MSSFRIFDTRPAGDPYRTPGEPAEVKRSKKAQARLAKHAAGSTDHDAFMALEDFGDEQRQATADELARDPAGLDENKTTHAVPGRPDLVFIKGRGVGGCSYIVISRAPVQPAQAYVERRSWADEDEAETDEAIQAIEQTVRVRR